MKKIFFLLPLLFLLSCGDNVNVPHITIFLSSGTYLAGWASRSTADGICKTEWEGQSSYLKNVSKNENTHMLVSFNGLDEVRIFTSVLAIPATLPIYAGKTKLADDWANFMAYGSKASLLQAGLTDAPLLVYWTGTSFIGATAGTCGSWSNTGSADYSFASASGTSFLNSSSIACGGLYRNVLCVTY